ncbi:atypical protein kinase C-like [Acyrthosiphon pisum]|uniref:Uncharacterized protein n=1 Tax=Acyrthosiphon pisum TaxID=7029 RepID=A0A8R2B763_ACYPI|nr:atypical protein kinase C-like [Acyrthosiphon pisum]|eukprot:XP_008185219.1 PREDICTED: atypical protein kinase C-like [Acyrthosiphon pisum]
MGIFCSCSKLQENSTFCKFCRTQFQGLRSQGSTFNQHKSHKNKNLHQLSENNCTNDSVVSDDTKGNCQTSLSTFCSDTALADTNGFSDQNDVIDQPADSVPVENPECKSDAEVGVSCKYSIDDFELMKIIGSGTYATVLMVQHKRSQCIYAMKVIEKECAAKNSDINWIHNEKNVFITVADCPFFVALHCCFQTTSRLFFVMEFVRGGDLLYFMRRKRRLPEDHVRFYAAEISLALNFLHTKGIIYLDLKLENVLLDHEGHIKLADYGLCKKLKWPGEKIDLFCGTPSYMAPEIIRSEPYGFSVDWWALGIILYEMLVGKCPFDIKDVPPNEYYNNITYQKILNNTLNIPEYVSGEAAWVLYGLLNKNAVDRLGCLSDIKDRLFFKSIDWKMLEQKKIRPYFIPRLISDRDLQHFDPEFTNKIIDLKPDDHYGQLSGHGFINFITMGFNGKYTVLLVEKSIYSNVVHKNSSVMADNGFKSIDVLLHKINYLVMLINSDKSTMLKNRTAAASRQIPLPTAYASTFTSNYLLDTNTVDMQSTALAIPKNKKLRQKIMKIKKNMTCRSPVLMTSASNMTLEPRKVSINTTNIIAREEHNMNLKIFKEK